MSKIIAAVDYFGCVLVALAVFELANTSSLIPPAWQLPYHPHSLLVMGLLLVLPMVVVAVVQARRTLERRRMAHDVAGTSEAR